MHILAVAYPLGKHSIFQVTEVRDPQRAQQIWACQVVAILIQNSLPAATGSTASPTTSVKMRSSSEGTGLALVVEAILRGVSGGVVVVSFGWSWCGHQGWQRHRGPAVALTTSLLNCTSAEHHQ
eukprot:2733773-Amphidinium_carterae.1